MCEPAKKVVIDEKDDLIDIKSAAALLPSVTPVTLRRWVKAGKVPHVLLPGGRLWFRREDILALMTPVQADPGVPK